MKKWGKNSYVGNLQVFDHSNFFFYYISSLGFASTYVEWKLCYQMLSVLLCGYRLFFEQTKKNN